MENNRNVFNYKKENTPFAKALRELFGIHKNIPLKSTGEYATHQKLADYIFKETRKSISRQAIGQWCKGISCPDFLTLPIIAEYFNVSYDFLLNENNVKTESGEKNLFCEVTGLHENSIKVICNCNKNEINALNLLIIHKEFKTIISKLRDCFDIFTAPLGYFKEANTPKDKKRIAKAIDTLNEYEVYTVSAKEYIYSKLGIANRCLNEIFAPYEDWSETERVLSDILD